MTSSTKSVSPYLPQLLGPKLQAQRQAVLEHPLWNAVVTGEANVEHLRAFALQDAWLVQHSRQLEALLVAHAPDEAARDTLLAKWDSKAVFAAQGSLHHFGAGLGLPKSAFDAPTPLAGCMALTTHFYYALARHGFLGLLASVSASESVFIDLCQRVGPALQQHYGLNDQQVAFFSLHDHLQESVNVGERALIERLCLTSEQREQVRAVVSQTFACEKLFYDTVLGAGASAT